MDDATRAGHAIGAASENGGSGQRARGVVPEVAPQSWWDRLWKPFWALPAACVLVALVVGGGLPMLEASWGSTEVRYVFQGGPDGARGMLGTIASAMISVTGLIFSITMVVLQLASSQFTPRLLAGFLQNRVVQLTLGVFVSTFVYALTVTRSVRGDNETEQFVPQFSVTLAFVMVLACVGLFLAFIHHITTSIQVSNVISHIGDDTVKLADKMFPEPASDAPTFGPSWSPQPGTRHCSLEAPRHGTITHVDYAVILRWAKEHDVVVTLDRPVGQFLTEGQHMLRVWGEFDESDDPEQTRKVYGAIGLGPQREMRQDVAFGLRQLVDIAERALSPGINDPTTAVQCIDEIHRILRLLVQRASPSPYIADDDGQVRIVHDPQAIDGLIEASVVEIAHYGKDSVQVPPRLRAMLEDLADVSAERYRGTVLELLDRHTPAPQNQEH